MKKYFEGIIDVDSASEIGLKNIDLQLPEAETFVHEKFNELYGECKLDMFNRDLTAEYIESFAELNAKIEEAVTDRKNTADRLCDEYGRFLKKIEAGIVPEVSSKRKKKSVERNERREYLKRVAPLPWWLDPSNILIILGLSGLAEISFLYILVHEILYQNAILTMVVVVSAALGLLMTPAILAYEFAAVGANTSPLKYSKMQIYGSLASFVLLFIAYALVRAFSVEVLGEYSTASNELLSILTVMLIVIPLVSAVLVYKIHYYQLTSMESKKRREAENEFADICISSAMESLPTVEEYRIRLDHQLEEKKQNAIKSLEDWKRHAVNVWRLELAKSIHADGAAADKIMLANAAKKSDEDLNSGY